jgi:hypothetical protein
MKRDGGDDAPRRRAGGWLAVVGLHLLLAAVYPLSIGPAVRFHGRTSNPTVQRTLETYYAPLVWLYENTPLRGPLDWYVELWRER